MEKRPARILQHARSALQAIASYTAEVPFAIHLSAFFKRNPQMGSKDRKSISQLCYAYWRLGKSLGEFSPFDRLVLASLLCETGSALLDGAREMGVADNLAFLVTTTNRDELRLQLEEQTSFQLEDIFPATDFLSEQIDREAFVWQHLVQPDLFLRVLSGKMGRVQSVLKAAGLTFEVLGTHTLSLPNGTRLDHLVEIKGLFEVQDFSSQATVADLPVKAEETWWDACAGAGGKTLALLDRYPGVKMLVSDVRESILHNLSSRVKQAGLDEVRKLCVDLSKPLPPGTLSEQSFDGILLDVPCTGSGTWGRTPEALVHFKGAEEIKRFAQLQRSIVRHALPYLKPEGHLIYITCSVYFLENEGTIDYLVNPLGLRLQSMKYVTGYANRADTLFVAQLSR